MVAPGTRPLSFQQIDPKISRKPYHYGRRAMPCRVHLKFWASRSGSMSCHRPAAPLFFRTWMRQALPLRAPFGRGVWTATRTRNLEIPLLKLNSRRKTVMFCIDCNIRIQPKHVPQTLHAAGSCCCQGGPTNQLVHHILA